jgi:hypothetical protein
MPYKNPNSIEAKRSRKETAKRYYLKNKEQISLKNKTDENRIKGLKINNWKRRGVIGDYSLLYETYKNATNCSCCNYEFNNDKNKCLDHNHLTGEFRQILCRNCNNWDNWEKINNE